MKHLLRNNYLIFAVCGAAVAAGFVLEMWPLSVAGVVLAALCGRWVSALFLALTLDVLYGTPSGLLHYLYFPVTLFALACVAARAAVRTRIRITHRDTL